MSSIVSFSHGWYHKVRKFYQQHEHAAKDFIRFTRTMHLCLSPYAHSPQDVDINPKTMPTEELYGHISLSTREWKDGLLSTVMRDLGAIPNEAPKWIILDGDLDANWIESMNSVMDDNRVRVPPETSTYNPTAAKHNINTCTCYGHLGKHTDSSGGVRYSVFFCICDRLFRVPSLPRWVYFQIRLVTPGAYSGFQRAHSSPSPHAHDFRNPGSQVRDPGNRKPGGHSLHIYSGGEAVALSHRELGNRLGV